MKNLKLLAIFTLVITSAITLPLNAATGTTKGCRLKIGDIYAGDIIFYIDPDNCHGLVCAPSNQATSADWRDAVDICKSLHTGGYSDWRLPTQDELNQMYINLYKSKLGNFATSYYWSSTTDASGMAYSQYFCNTYVYRFVTRNYLFYVRAVREF